MDRNWIPRPGELVRLRGEREPRLVEQVLRVKHTGETVLRLRGVKILVPADQVCRVFSKN